LVNAETATFWEVLFIYDVIILFLLLRKGFETREEMLRYSVKPPSLLVILIRDGSYRNLGSLGYFTKLCPCRNNVLRV